jgi:hypothetical protein
LSEVLFQNQFYVKGIVELTHASGYSCYTQTVVNFVGQACASIFTSQITTTVTDGLALTPLLATLHPKTEAVNGYGVSIRYNANDFASSTSTPSSSSLSTTASTSATNSTSQSPASSSGLSTGAKAGIGVGVVVVALVALLSLGFFIIQKRKVRGGASVHLLYPLHEVDGTAGRDKPLPVKQVHGVFTPPFELDGSLRP